MLNLHEKIESAYNIASQDFNTLNDLAKVCKLLELKKLLDFIEQGANAGMEELSDQDLTRFEEADGLFVDLWSAYNVLFDNSEIKAKMLLASSPEVVNQCLQEQTEEFLSKVANAANSNEETHQLASTIVAEVSSNFSLSAQYAELTGVNLEMDQEI